MEFLILPDTPGGARVSAITSDRAPAAGVEVIPHASGRPWIVGRWPTGTVTWAAAGRARVAVLGCSSATVSRLERALVDARSVADLDGAAIGLAGAFHLVASIGDRIRAQGSISSAHQIFFTDVAGVPVAADRPQTLAALNGGRPEEELLAARLIAPWPPWPLSEQCLWKGVGALPAGCYLEIEAGIRSRVVRWWRPPPPELPLATAAPRVRSALREAVAVRTRGRDIVSADLSGGMDSTSLCYLAAGAGTAADDTPAGGRAGLLTTRWEAADPADEDRLWADRAARGLPAADHLVLPHRTSPAWFAGLTELDPDIEAPFAWIRTRARLTHLARQVAARGSTIHLTGHGGDELFLTTPLYLHTLLRTQGLRAIGCLRAQRALYRWPLGSTLRALLGNASFGAWLAGTAGTLTEPIREAAPRPSFGWGIAHRLPSWVTAEAADAARGLLREAGRADPEPLAPLRGQHAALQDARLCGDTLRRVDRLTSRSGVSWQAPFVDDRVIEAALAVRTADVATPDRYKPALAEAMRGLVPDEILGRSTKSEYSAEIYRSLRRHRAELLELCEDMRLARLGLVDAAALRQALLVLPPSSLTLMPLVTTFACESWVRAIENGDRP
ncbi:MAG TPA: asparagine synthase-related protein [Streptosporangiaceae bacterium]|nr:asparagine synthase-related protein [Streptosporangiaceae bacterium]